LMSAIGKRDDALASAAGFVARRGPWINIRRLSTSPFRAKLADRPHRRATQAMSGQVTCFAATVNYVIARAGLSWSRCSILRFLNSIAHHLLKTEYILGSFRNLPCFGESRSDSPRNLKFQSTTFAAIIGLGMREKRPLMHRSGQARNNNFPLNSYLPASTFRSASALE